MIGKIAISGFIFFAASSCSVISRISGDATPKQEFIRQIESADCDNSDRYEAAQRLFVASGARKEDVRTESFKNVKNILVTIPGKTDETVIVGAHYDKTTLGCGAIDNWSGVVIVANLYRTLKKKNLNKTFRFVAFGDEEKGLLGSKAMADAIPVKTLKDHCAMVNFDSFGFTDLWALHRTSDPKMIDLASNAANKKGKTLVSKSYAGANSDSLLFKAKGIPSITLSGVGEDWKNYLHKKSDLAQNLNAEKIYENYLFSIDFLKELDAKNCAELR